MVAPQQRPRTPAPDPRKLREEKARKEAEERNVAFNAFEVKAHVDDEVFTFCNGDVTSLDVAALRAATGTTIISPVLNMLQYFAPDMTVVALDKLAELVFLARRQAGERPDFDDVAAGITNRSVVWIEYPEGEMPAPTEEVHLDPPVSGDG